MAGNNKPFGKDLTIGEIFPGFEEWLRMQFPHKPQSPPSRKDLLSRAKSARALRPRERREAVLEIIQKSLRKDEPPVCTVAEIFEAAYSDPTGQEYWRLWLTYGEPEKAAELLAAHFLLEAPDPAIIADYRGWSWHRLCSAALNRYPSGRLADRFRSVAGDEESAHLVAPSLRAFLAGASEEPVEAHPALDLKSKSKPRKKKAVKLLGAIAALKKLYPKGRPVLKRPAIRAAVEEELKYKVSPTTLDRALTVAWE